MHQPRTLPIWATQCSQHAVDVTRRAGSSLYRKTHWLVEHHDIGVLEEDDRLQEGSILLRGGRIFPGRGCLNLKRWNANRLPGLEASLGLRALAIYPHFTFANDALDVTEGQARKPCLEKTIDPHARFIGRNGNGLDLAGRL